MKLEVFHLGLPAEKQQKLSQQNVETHTHRSPDWTGIDQTTKFPQFADRGNRVVSFMCWSRDFNQDIDVLVECGFFSVGNGDTVRCFQCGGGLQNWKPTDYPWREHARFFPHCSYLQDKNGLDYVKSVHAEDDVNDNSEAPGVQKTQPQFA